MDDKEKQIEEKTVLEDATSEEKSDPELQNTLHETGIKDFIEETQDLIDNKNSLLVAFGTIGTIIITLLASFFYLLGDSFHRGYLKAFNIENTLFPVSFQQCLLIGLHALKSVGFKVVPTLAAFIGGLLFLFLYIALMWPEKTGDLNPQTIAEKKTEQKDIFHLLSKGHSSPQCILFLY
ncbi:MAG: hypothetical protein ABSB95_13995 [Dissulfurispiraceae bacterium]|jgi:hypothetical protein